MVSKITIEHVDGQVVTVLFGPERKIGPLHMSEGHTVESEKPLPISRVRNLTTDREVPGEVAQFGRNLTDEEIEGLLGEPLSGHIPRTSTDGNPIDGERLMVTKAGFAALAEHGEKPETRQQRRETKPAAVKEKKARRSSFEPKKLPVRGWDTIIQQWMAWLGTREKRTLNYSDFAGLAGVFVGDLSKYRRGVKPFTDYQQKKFAKALGVTVEQFQKGPGSLDDKGTAEKPEQPADPAPVKKTEKKDPSAIVLAEGSTVAAVCEACRAGEFGEKRQCDGCALIKFGPTDIETDPYCKPVTSAAKNHICLHCVRKNRGQCDICTLTVAIEAESLITTGASLDAAVDMAVDNYTAAFERITERFDERAAAR